ncbi:gibberellin-regulated protein 1-like precursor [Tripterygium wilfordii]|uniref:Gibberellin-regulated protein 1-like n=1 Tax=Tripterygium wilfordii TaxID=458696 RepID=A0A7J7D3M3_TRIWF|nr:gibberellin-regulated protein 1-like [Tripterygium wilfordii]KAF5740859.1 gibberellin-regulated protein 1-like precursor [Tripterygium wilfordii]
MAIASNSLIASLLISLLLLHLAEADHLLQENTNCGWACLWRCVSSKRPNLCNQACGSCCAQCNCVPPGTSGNYEACPCYATLKTHNGKRKCP